MAVNYKVADNHYYTAFSALRMARFSQRMGIRNSTVLFFLHSRVLRTSIVVVR
jgi:hypothetical protein